MTQDWVKEAGLEQPPGNFVKNVMQSINAQVVGQRVYRPLLSKRGWFLASAFFVASIALLYFFPIGELNYLNDVKIIELPAIKNPFEGVEVSKTMIYGIGFLALFLVQIPFLKKRFAN